MEWRETENSERVGVGGEERKGEEKKRKEGRRRGKREEERREKGRGEKGGGTCSISSPCMLKGGLKINRSANIDSTFREQASHPKLTFSTLTILICSPATDQALVNFCLSASGSLACPR